jgi:molybdopterin-guanine dinucleotide biosynthesis protein A
MALSLTTSVVAVILAGGRSSRMGRDKALLSVEGQTLIHRTCEVAIACTDAVYVVTSRGDRYRPLLPPGVHLLAEPAAAVPPGPLVALGDALGKICTEGDIAPDWVLALACDLPNLSAAVLSRWRQALVDLAPDVVAYLPQRDDRWEPLCGFYRAAAGDSMRQYGESGGRGSKTGSKGRSLQAWLHQQSVVAIPSVEDRLLVNLNTPADWAQWEAAGDR